MSKAGAIGDRQNKSAHLSDDVFCITSRRNYAPPWQNITAACGIPSPQKKANGQYSNRPTVGAHHQPLHLTQTSVRVLIKTKNQNTTINQTRLVVVDAVVPTHDEDNPACSVGTSRRRRRKKVNIYMHIVCFILLFLPILHHPNVVLCRYHRRRIDKGGSTEAHCGSMPYKGGGRGERERSARRRIDTREAGAGKEMRRRAADR